MTAWDSGSIGTKPSMNQKPIDRRFWKMPSINR